MTENAAVVVQKELMADERLMWSGRPRQGVVFRSQDSYMIPFSIFWCGFAVYWTYGVITSHAPIFFHIFGLIFVCIGAYVVFGRFVHDYIARKNTVYGLTDRRVLIITGPGKLKTLDLKQLAEISLSEKKNRSGTITFGSTQTEQSWIAMADWTGKFARSIPKFEMIDNVRHVYDMMCKAQGEQKK